jgi:TrmH family RNA methyltransferase
MSGGETITSARNPRVLVAARLREGRHRRRGGKLLIDGWSELVRAAEAGIQFEEFFVSEALLEPQQQSQLAAIASSCGAALLHCSPHVYEKLAYGSGRSGVVAVARVPDTSLERLRLSPSPLVCVLEGVEKPGNVGAVARSADAAGLEALIVADGNTDLFNPNAVRASLGTIFTLSLATAMSDEVRPWLAANELQVVVATVDAPRLYTEVDFTQPTAIVLGSEAHGLTATWRDENTVAARIPMRGAADSLNVSVTAAVMFYEARRQRGST